MSSSDIPVEIQVPVIPMVKHLESTLNCEDLDEQEWDEDYDNEMKNNKRRRTKSLDEGFKMLVSESEATPLVNAIQAQFLNEASQMSILSLNESPSPCTKKQDQSQQQQQSPTQEQKQIRIDTLRALPTIECASITGHKASLTPTPQSFSQLKKKLNTENWRLFENYSD